jgi:tetratricopeptide (TPR) repeat protein
MITVSRSAYWKEIYGTTPEWDTAEHYALIAKEMAEQLDAPIELSATLGSLVRVYGARGLWGERVQVAQQRLTVSREAHFEDLRENLDILTQTGVALMGIGEYAQAIPHLLQAEVLGDQLQDIHGIASAMVNQGQCWLRLDRWDEVLIAEEKLKALQRRHPLERLGSICWLLSFSAAVHALRGDNVQAVQLRNESYEIMIDLTVTEENWVRENHY